MTGRTVLIVEDEGLIALHLNELLEDAGYRVAGPVSSGAMALRELDTTPAPDLVLMDIGLAGSPDGIETARQIRGRSAIPIIFLTAYSSEKVLDRMREVRPEGYLTKPVREEDLIALVRQVLAGRGSTGTPG
jgi:CheY-like chemotaxis protein